MPEIYPVPYEIKEVPPKPVSGSGTVQVIPMVEVKEGKDEPTEANAGTVWIEED